MNINNGRQSIASFIFSHANSNIDRPMVENSRASKSKVFIGVLSKFPQLKRSILRIAMSYFATGLQWITVTQRTLEWTTLRSLDSG